MEIVFGNGYAHRNVFIYRGGLCVDSTSIFTFDTTWRRVIVELLMGNFYVRGRRLSELFKYVVNQYEIGNDRIEIPRSLYQ